MCLRRRALLLRRPALLNTQSIKITFSINHDHCKHLDLKVFSTYSHHSTPLQLISRDHHKCFKTSISYYGFMFSTAVNFQSLLIPLPFLPTTCFFLQWVSFLGSWDSFKWLKCWKNSWQPCCVLVDGVTEKVMHPIYIFWLKRHRQLQMICSQFFSYSMEGLRKAFHRLSSIGLLRRKDFAIHLASAVLPPSAHSTQKTTCFLWMGTNTAVVKQARGTKLTQNMKPTLSVFGSHCGVLQFLVLSSPPQFLDLVKGP